MSDIRGKCYFATETTKYIYTNVTPIRGVRLSVNPPGLIWTNSLSLDIPICCKIKITMCLGDIFMWGKGGGINKMLQQKV